MDNYTQRYIEAIKFCFREPENTDDQLKQVIDKIYEDGFQDGVDDHIDVVDQLKEEILQLKQRIIELEFK